MYCVKSNKFKNTHCILYFPTSFLCTSKFNSCDQMLEVTIIQTLYSQSLCGMNVVECFFNSSVFFFPCAFHRQYQKKPEAGDTYEPEPIKTVEGVKLKSMALSLRGCSVSVFEGISWTHVYFFQEKVCFLKVVALEWYMFWSVRQNEKLKGVMGFTLGVQMMRIFQDAGIIFSDSFFS